MPSIRGVMQAVILVVILAGATACAAPTVDTAAEASALTARGEALAAAEAAKDRETALTFWAADAIVQPAGMPQIQGREAVSALYQTYFDSSGLKSFESMASGVTVAQSGDVAYETGVNRMVFATPNGDMLDVGKYLAVWKKIDGVWYVAALSFTSDAPAPVPMPMPVPK